MPAPSPTNCEVISLLPRLLENAAREVHALDRQGLDFTSAGRRLETLWAHAREEYRAA